MSDSNKKRIWVVGSGSLYEEIHSALPPSLFHVKWVPADELEHRLGEKDDAAGLVLVAVETAADLEVIRQARSYALGPVVAVVSVAVPELKARALDSGITEAVSRPVDPIALASYSAEEAGAPCVFPAIQESARRDLSDYGMIFGPSPAMSEIRTLIDRIAETDVPVLITGEAGTGKEWVARAIHRRSHRSAGPFIKVDASALPAGIIDQGTVLLDHVEDMNWTLQGQWLYRLQDDDTRPHGWTPAGADALRILATAHRNLERAVERGQFRKELYYRLNVITVAVPPLRDRREDIPVLTAHFLKKYAAEYDKKGYRLSPFTEAFFRTYGWPGNVRELESLIREILASGDEAQAIAPLRYENGRRQATERRDALNPPRAVPRLKDVARRAAQAAERQFIMEVLAENRWNRRRTAQILQISYRTLLYKIKQGWLDVNI